MKIEISSVDLKNLISKSFDEAWEEVYAIVKNFRSPKAKKFLELVSNTMYHNLKEYKKGNIDLKDEDIPLFSLESKIIDKPKLVSKPKIETSKKSRKSIRKNKKKKSKN